MGRGPRGKLREHWALLSDVWRERLRRRYDLFYVYGTPATPAALAALLGVRGRRVIYHNPDFLEPSTHPVRVFIERRLARKAAGLVLNEPNRARFFRSFYRLQTRPVVVPTSLPACWPVPERADAVRSELLSRLDCGEAPVLVMHHGSYANVRCGGTIIEALARLPRRFGVVFTGGEPGTPAADACGRHAAAAGVRDRIVLLPRLPFRELLRYTVCCDIGLLLYRDDGIGNFYQAPGRLTEYLACGLPFVASAFPGLELLALRYGIGQCADPTDPDALARTLQDVQAARESEDDPAARIRDVFLNHLSFDHFADRIVDLVEALTSA
jgi:glycosyltransferase involved in cell wall biosynthesis